MTIEKISLVPFRDILAIEIKCPHCHARFSFPLSRFDRLVTECPNCNQHWIREAAASTTETDSSLFLQFILRLREIQNRDFASLLRIHVKTEDEPEQNAEKRAKTSPASHAEADRG